MVVKILTLLSLLLVGGCSNFWSTMREQTDEEARFVTQTCTAVGSRVRHDCERVDPGVSQIEAGTMRTREH